MNNMNFKTLINKFCSDYNLPPCTLLVDDNFLNGDWGLYIRRNKPFKIPAKIVVSDQHSDLATIGHELAHHYQYLKYKPSTHHDSTFSNAISVIQRWLKRVYDINIDIR